MEEVWKDVLGFEGLYKISSLGRCLKLATGKYPEKILPEGGNDNGAGYKSYPLVKESKLKVSYIHRLVAQAFIPNPENKSQVHHIDHDRSNNRVDNLEWVTPSENICYGVAEGRINNKVRGPNNVVDELMCRKVANMKFNGYTVQAIADELELPRTTVSSVVNGRSKGKMFEKFYEELTKTPCTQDLEML